jgi:DNA gyrase, B subunit
MVKDVEVQWTDDDIEKIQRKPNLYIRKYGNEGCNHLSHEIIQNAIDEVIDETSNGDMLTIRIDYPSGKLTVSDNGRGFPETKYPLDIFCTKIQSGSKANRDQSGGTAGEFGIGATVCNALSSYFRITSNRSKEKYIHTIEFENGKMISDKKKDNPKKLHGSTVEFIPNPKYLGKNSHIVYEDIHKWIKDMSYLLSSEKKSIEIVFEVYDDNKAIIKEKIKPQLFSSLLSTIVKKQAVSPISFNKRTNFMETTHLNEKPIEKELYLDVSFTYDDITDVNEPNIVESFCNYTRTTDGGVHVQAVDEAICRYLQTETKKRLSDKEKEKIDILWQDVRTDLRLLINLTSNGQVQFVGNAKTKIGNENFIPIIKELVNDSLTNIFNDNEALLNSYCKIVKTNAKARIELNKAKKSVSIKTKSNPFMDKLSKRYYSCNNRGKAYKEIYLVEGQKSAAGSIASGRNPDVQAVYGFRGMTANPYKRDNISIMENEELKEYCERIHYDIKSGNVEDVYFNKIIMSFDADSDGYGISSGVAAFHAKFARPIVEAGLLYKVYPPLYLIDDKNHPYIRNKEEYIEVYRDNIIRNYTITSIGNNNSKLSKSEFKEFIDITKYYTETLTRVASHYSVNRYLIELVGYHITMYILAKYLKNNKNLDINEVLDYYEDLPQEVYKSHINTALNDQKFVSSFMKDIQDEFPEITLNEKYLTGVIDGKYQVIKIGYNLMKKLSDLTETFITYGLHITYSEKKSDEIKSTIGYMLDSASKYIPKIITRYKGLGEANYDQIAETIMDPSKRILVQLTFDDIERDLKIFDTLHGISTDDKKSRKQMMKSYKIRREDIDN